jgi:uncharacterized protein VirK/YbjX
MQATVSFSNQSKTFSKNIYLEKSLKYILRSLLTTQEINELMKHNDEDFDTVLSSNQYYKLYKQDRSYITIKVC